MTEDTENTEQSAFDSQSENTVGQQEDTDAEKTIETTADEQSQKNMIAAVPPLSEEGTIYTYVQDLLNAGEDTSEAEWIQNALQEKFGESYNLEKLAGDEKYAADFFAIGLHYLQEQCEKIKTNAFSLNAENLNSCIEDINNLALLQIDASKYSRDNYNRLVRKRIKHIKLLHDTFEVFNTGRQIFEQITSGAETDTSQIMIEDSVQHLEELYSGNVINKEQLALGYHNIAVLFEKSARQKNELKEVVTQTDKKNDYMKKALSLTSDVKLIKTCYECLPDNYPAKMQIIREACDRAFENGNLSNSGLFTLHRLYGKSLETVSISERFSPSFAASQAEALSHYKMALSYAQMPEWQAKILRSISKLQKTDSPDEYYATRMDLISNHLRGKTKIRELLKLAAEVTSPEKKILSLESAANELADAGQLPKEERSLLMSNVIHNLRQLYAPNEKKKLAVLSTLEKKYCRPEKKSNIGLLRISSKGNDYFSENR